MWPKATGYDQMPPVMDGNLNEQLNSMLRMLYWVFKYVSTYYTPMIFKFLWKK